MKIKTLKDFETVFYLNDYKKQIKKESKQLRDLRKGKRDRWS